MIATVTVALLKVFLDCSSGGCHEDYLREEIELVEYVRDRTDADVHVLVTRAQTGARGQEYTLAFIDQGRFSATTRTLTVTSEASDSDDRVRRALATALTVGLLSYVAPDTIPASLEVTAELRAGAPGAASAADDPWNRWIFSLNGNAELNAEESQRERDWGVSFGADRITPQWKLTFGANLNQSRQEFDLDEDQPLSVERRNRRVRWLGVRALGDHWSTGLTGEVRSSTFDNIALDMRIALRKSVANHLNDFSKDHPPYVVDLLRSWDLQHPHTAWIAKRACRTLIKAGDPAALALFAFSSKARVRVTDLVVTPKRLRLGDTLGFSFTVTSEATHTQPLVVDYAVHYQKADGRMARKVFKLKEVKLRPRAAITLSKRQRIVDFSTRKHYAGTHLVEVMVNGRVLAKAVFSLKC